MTRQFNHFLENNFIQFSTLECIQGDLIAMSAQQQEGAGTSSVDDEQVMDQSNNSLLHEAASGGSLAVLTKLLQGLRVNDRRETLEQKLTVAEQATTPLIIAAKNGNLEAVKLLLDYGADIEARGAYAVYLKISVALELHVVLILL